MSNKSKSFQIRIKGKYGCFTRPEAKAERATYPIITPSAARATIEAILWKPAIKYTISKIMVLDHKPKYVTVKRNEIANKISTRNAISWSEGKTEPLSYYADDSKNRQQRNSLILKDPDYAVEFFFEMTDKAGESDNLKKFEEMLERRIEKGQYFSMPYLGCREFPAEICFYNGVPESARYDEEQDLGLVLYDMDYREGEERHFPLFFHAVISKKGIIENIHPIGGKE